MRTMIFVLMNGRFRPTPWMVLLLMLRGTSNLALTSSGVVEDARWHAERTKVIFGD